MGLSDVHKSTAVLTCDKCGNPITEVWKGRVVVTDNPKVDKAQGIYHYDCLDFDVPYTDEFRVYELAKYIYQVLQSLYLVEKFENGREQQVLIKFPHIVSII